jgi:hypothetical protein
MKVLIACEESQVVCKAFRARGHEAYSCDIIDCSGGHPEWHLKGSVDRCMYDGWDMMIAHPPCTYLCNSGVQWLYNKDGSKNEDRWLKLLEARQFFKMLYRSGIEKICVENPIPHKYFYLNGVPKYTQIIQPWMFGHLETKATCLWLKGLPKLVETDNVREEMLKLPKNQQQRLHYLPPGPERARLRSMTFTGIGNAFAAQWG